MKKTIKVILIFLCTFTILIFGLYVYFFIYGSEVVSPRVLSVDSIRVTDDI